MTKHSTAQHACHTTGSVLTTNLHPLLLLAPHLFPPIVQVYGRVVAAATLLLFWAAACLCMGGWTAEGLTWRTSGHLTLTHGAGRSCLTAR